MKFRAAMVPVAFLVGAVCATATGAAFAAEGGGGPSAPPVTKSAAPANPSKGSSPAQKKVDDGSAPDVARAARELGVPLDRLNDALAQTKQWIPTTTQRPTQEVLAGHVAGILDLPAGRVLTVLAETGIFGAPGNG